MHLALSVSIALCALFVQSGLGAYEADRITSLPYLDKLPPFNMYSGYLDSDDHGDRHLFYWFVESSSNKRTDPLLLWFNGGPVCSSLLGLLTEHGPLKFKDDGTLTLENNPYSWNQVANILYLESPAGTGLSYVDSKNYTMDDFDTAIQNAKGVQSFFKKFPEYQKNDFYVAGESYGGIYVSMTVSQLLEIPEVNLKGFAVGNGVLKMDDLENSIAYFHYYHGMLSDAEWATLTGECCSEGGPNRCNFVKDAKNKEVCQQMMTKVQHLAWYPGLSTYNLYSECHYTSTGISTVYQEQDNTFYTTYFGWPFGWTKEAQMEKAKQSLIPRHMLRAGLACTNFTAVTAYLNEEEVRKALHVSEKAFAWQPCSKNMHYIQKVQDTTPYFEKAIKRNMRMMVYNGDVDMACNFLGDEWFVDRLPLKNPSARKMWWYTEVDGSKQVGGFIKTFDQMSLVTVRGSGHMVPADKPMVALELITNFLQDRPFTHQ